MHYLFSKSPLVYFLRLLQFFARLHYLRAWNRLGLGKIAYPQEQFKTIAYATLEGGLGGGTNKVYYAGLENKE